MKPKINKQVKEYMAALGRLGSRKAKGRGGKKAARRMTPEQRQERARKAATTRWERHRAALALCSAEQAAAAQAAGEGDKGAILGVADWMAEEAIIRGGE